VLRQGRTTRQHGAELTYDGRDDRPFVEWETEDNRRFVRPEREEALA
jgi:hypothetical protein